MMAPTRIPRTSGDRATQQRSRSRHILLLLSIAGFLALGQTGCVFRRMTIRTDPPGALVMLDGEEVGYTPYTADFTYYGTREIKLMMPGYETLTVEQKFPTPWYQYPGIEFVADNLSPFKVTNRHEFHYPLQQQKIVPTDELYDRASSHRSESLSSP